MKKRTLNTRPSIMENAVIIKIKQSKGVGDIFKIKDFIQKQHHLNYTRVYCDKQRHEVCVLGCELKAIEKMIQRFAKGMSYAGHGGYRWNYELDQCKIDIEPFIRRDEQGRSKQEIDEIKKEKARLELKWSKDKNEYEKEIRERSTIIKEKEEKIEELESLHIQDTKIIKNEREKKKEFERQWKEYEVPLYKIAIRRVKEFFNKGG